MKMILAVLAVVLLASGAASAQAVVRIQGLSGGYPVAVTGTVIIGGSSSTVIVLPGGITTAEPIACRNAAGATSSPCAVGATSTTILNTNTNRKQCLIQNCDIVPFYCSASGSVSSTAFEWILKAATATSTGDGGSYTCNQGPATENRAIRCMPSGSATSTLCVSAGQ